VEKIDPSGRPEAVFLASFHAGIKFGRAPSQGQKIGQKIQGMPLAGVLVGETACVRKYL